MVQITATSQEALLSRRRELRRRRRRRLFEATWRTLLLGSLTGGLIWVATLPVWVLRGPEQVVVEGNEVLPDQTIQSLLPLSYPQLLIRVQPQQLAQQLEAVVPIESVTVTRRLFPPGLTVQVHERRPVAVAVQGNDTGFLDANGTWMSLSNYPTLREVTTPSLRVVGLGAWGKLRWATLYRQIEQSPIAISEVDWRDEANLILKTELGTVHCGAYSPPEFVAQLAALDQMRALPTYLDPTDIDYIDLRNPRSPAISMIQPASQSAEDDPSGAERRSGRTSASVAEDTSSPQPDRPEVP